MPICCNPAACSQGPSSLGHKSSFSQTDGRSPLPPKTKTRQTKNTLQTEEEKKKKSFFAIQDKQRVLTCTKWPLSGPWYLHLQERSSPAFHRLLPPRCFEGQLLCSREEGEGCCLVSPKWLHNQRPKQTANRQLD